MSNSNTRRVHQTSLVKRESWINKHETQAENAQSSAENRNFLYPSVKLFFNFFYSQNHPTTYKFSGNSAFGNIAPPGKNPLASAWLQSDHPNTLYTNRTIPVGRTAGGRFTDRKCPRYLDTFHRIY